jgi:hypothetical protein
MGAGRHDRTDREATAPDIEGDGLASPGQLDQLEGMTDTDVLRGDLEARPPNEIQPDTPLGESFEMLESLELRTGETDDPVVAAEEGLAWVAPSDPPVVPGEADDWGPRIAAGFGMTARDEPFDADHHASALPDEDEVAARVREAILADSGTSRYADRIGIDVDGTRVVLVGRVEDIDDEDLLVAVASTATGVGEVMSRLDVETI